MKKKVLMGIMLAFSIALIGGCGAVEENESNTRRQQREEENIKDKSENDNDDSEDTDEIDIEDDQSDIEEDNQTSSDTDFQYPGEKIVLENVSFIIPESWDGKYVIEEDEDSVSIYQKASYEEADFSGYLFSIIKASAASYYHPNGWIIGFDDEYLYSIGFPSDVSYDYENDEISEEYIEMMEDLDLLQTSILIEGKDVHRNISEYKLPMSSYYEYGEDDYLDFDYRDMIIAYNEILAKAGYDFSDAEDDYFNYYFSGMTWYAPNPSFTKDDLTDIEKHNLDYIGKMIEERKAELTPPVMLLEDIELEIDLDGDGKDEKIVYSNNDSNHSDGYGDFYPLITIDGNDYDIYEDGPEENIYYADVAEHAYVTDISPYFDGKEIAILDYGPSDDYMTYFYGYKDGSLYYIDCIEGFITEPEVKLYSFYDYGGGFIAPKRINTFGTAYANAHYWYDVDNACMEQTQYDLYDYEIIQSHKLLKDLTVKMFMDEDAPTRQLSKGDVVYFVATDDKEWLEIKDSNGIMAYVHIANTDYPPTIDNGDSKDVVEEVFDNILYAD